ncbi:terpenoid synthase [Lophiostoma macrostomum CBS 122681]|uniref:Terpene synthase n=1 Tax=Lophiostoma macrostomum CBS 122681 TaxID=1314788 RepID=A0A6A6T3T6_9PLEO|nr:terpenoid synthase [Lophiostoma macrostomum CBS 122681]
MLRIVRGQTVVAPDLQAMMAHWPAAINPNLDDLEKATIDRFEWLFPDPANSKRLQKMKKTQAALFAAMWWPYVPLEALYTVAWLSIWLFVWDDETDSAEFSDLVHDFKRASEFRCDTLQFIRESLQLQSSSDSDDSSSSNGSTTSSESDSIIITNFDHVGQAVANFGNSRVTARFYEELELFVNMTELEQKVHLSGELPTVSEYLERRMGSSGVHVCLALTEYSLDMELPEEVMNDPEMDTLWHETNMNISVCNDILSVKKELEVGQTDSLIPLLALELGSVQAALDDASRMMQDSVELIDKAADSLLARYGHDASVHANLQKFVDGCKYACTGNLNWSLVSGRYRLGSNTTQGGLRLKL